MIPMSYFAPIGEWLLITILAIISLFKYIYKPIKIDFSNILRDSFYEFHSQPRGYDYRSTFPVKNILEATIET